MVPLASIIVSCAILLSISSSVLLVNAHDELDKLNCDENWSKFRTEYAKSYKDLHEAESRKEIFCKNLRFVKTKNAELDQDNAYGINHMSDWAKEQLQSLTMQSSPEALLKDSPNIRSISGRQMSRYLSTWKDFAAPDSVDYSLDPRIVGPAKNQGECASCWAFATAGLIEANEHKWDPSIKQVTPLSEQQMVDCIDERGCQPKSPYESLEYVFEVGGLQTESDYKYVSDKDTSAHRCKFNATQIHPATKKLRNFYMLCRSDEQILKQLVAAQGPVIILTHCPQSLFSLKSDIFTDPRCKEDSVGQHLMLLVGYGTSNSGRDYWIVKNSWGTGWGVNGFGKIARNQNMCGIGGFQAVLDWK